MRLVRMRKCCSSQLLIEIYPYSVEEAREFFQRKNKDGQVAASIVCVLHNDDDGERYRRILSCFGFKVVKIYGGIMMACFPRYNGASGHYEVSLPKLKKKRTVRHIDLPF